MGVGGVESHNCKTQNGFTRQIMTKRQKTPAHSELHNIPHNIFTFPFK